MCPRAKSHSALDNKTASKYCNYISECRKNANSSGPSNPKPTIPSTHKDQKPPTPNCTQTDITNSNELPPDHNTTHTSQPKSSSVAHHRTSQPKSSTVPPPRLSKLLSSAAVHRKSHHKSSSEPTPHVSKPKSYTKDHHLKDDLPTEPPSTPPPNRPSLFPADDTIKTPSNPAPMLPSQVDVRFPAAPSTDLPNNTPRHPTTTQQHRDERSRITEKENKNMSKLPCTKTIPPNTPYLRPRPPTDALKEAVSLVANWQQPEPEPCNFKFEISAEAAEHNLGIIRGHQHDLDAALKTDGGTPLCYGSEFKPPSILSFLLENHPLWDSISSSLSDGIKYPL